MTDENEPVVDSPVSACSFSVTEPMLLALRQTRPWAKFVAILGYIFVGLMMAGGLFYMYIAFNSPWGNASGVFVGMGVMYFVFGVLYFFPALYLFRFASSIGLLNDGGGEKEMETALANQKSFWKFVGILTLISFGIGIVGIASAIIMPLMNFTGH